MKKILLIGLLLLFVPIALTGCAKHEVETDADRIHLIYSMEFTEICKHDDIYYVKHNDTAIIYMVYFGIGATGQAGTYKMGMSVLYNSNGVPMTYEEFQTIHTHNK